MNLTQIVLEIDQLNSQSDELWKNSNFQDSLQMAFKALKLSEEHHYSKGMADASRNIGTIYSIQAKNIEAQDFLEKALQNYEIMQDDLGQIRCLTNLGVINGNVGNFQNALNLFISALNLSKKNNYTKLIGDLSLNLGSVYRKMGDLDKAFQNYKTAAQLKNQIGDEIGLGSVFNNLGNFYQQKLDSSLALGYFKKALRIWEKHQYKRGMATVLNNISSLLIERKEIDKAISFIEKQLAISMELNLNQTFCMGYLQLATIYINKGLYPNAWDYLSSATQAIEEINDNELRVFYLNLLAEYYKHTGQYEESYSSLREIIRLKDNIFNDQLTHKIADIETNYQIKQKEQEKELYRLKNVELVQANNEIENQKSELAHMNEILLQMDKSKDTILRIVSHDLKNLIGSVYSVLDLLRYENLSDRALNYLNLIDQSTQKALQLVKDLLEANTIEMKDFKLDLSPYNIRDILESYKITFQMQAEVKKINLTLESDFQELLVNIDPNRFWQLFSNIVFNAIKFTRPQGQVIIRAEDKGSFCQISVQDNGIGIPGDLMPIIFDKFTKAKRKGTDGEMTFGIGLSIVKRLTELHQGIIEVFSKENEGTTFMIKLPVIKENGGA